MMRSPRRTVSLTVFLALSLFAASCDQTPPSAPDLRPQAIVDGYRLVQPDSTLDSGSAEANTVEATFGSEGGSLAVNGHVLTILPNSLLEKTRFTMQTVPGTIQVTLNAYSDETGLPVVAFPSPLMLRMSYGTAKVSNPNRLAIAWVVNGQIAMIQPSDVDKSNKTVATWLYHFSDYALIGD